MKQGCDCTETIDELAKTAGGVNRLLAFARTSTPGEHLPDCSEVEAGVDLPPDQVNAPSHYTSDPSGVECLTIVRHRNFNVGNAIKYLWRAGLKGDGSRHVEDLRKAIFYIEDEIRRLEGVDN